MKLAEEAAEATEEAAAEEEAEVREVFISLFTCSL